MSHILYDDISAMDKRYRATFINSISGFKAASLIGTIDKNKNPNLAIFSSIFHLGSHPPLIGFISRPGSVSRNTLENILETNCYTINHISTPFYKEAHQTSARYAKGISEFEEVGLTPEFREVISAPYVKESQVKYGLEFIEKIDIKINNTELVIGKIIEIIVPSDIISQDGFVDIEKAQTITCSGLDSYHMTTRIARLSYAKPETIPHQIG